MKTKQRNKVDKKVIEKLSELNFNALYNLAMNCYKKSENNKKLEKGDINKNKSNV